MSEQLVLDREYGNEVDLDEESFVADAALDAANVPDEYRSYTPREYVAAIFGPRGSGKDIYLTRMALISLAAGYPVFTNAILHPERFGIENKPRDIDIQYLLRFDPSLTGAVILISEINTWVKKKRPMYTSNLLVGDFLMQLRKRNLRVAVTTQFDYLPGEMGDQVDLQIQAQDLFWSEWGREARLAKGTTFLYTFMDVSGIFTGQKGTQWQWGLRNAQKLWKGFETGQIFDPLQWAHRTVLEGGDRIFNIEEGEIRSANETGMQARQRNRRKYNEYKVETWAMLRRKGFLEHVQTHNAIVDETEDQAIFSIDKLRKSLDHLKGKRKQEMQIICNRLHDYAKEKQIAWFSPGGTTIILAKPIPEAADAE